jgi:hypothetical protein
MGSPSPHIFFRKRSLAEGATSLLEYDGDFGSGAYRISTQGQNEAKHD